MKKTVASTPNVVAIETPVTDTIYAYDPAYDDVKAEFFEKLPELSDGEVKHAPRAGDNIDISAETLDSAILGFAHSKGWVDLGVHHGGASEEMIREFAKRIFGPSEMKAGGSMANSFDAMVHSQVNGQPLVNGLFLTNVGADLAGEVFTQSLAGSVKSTSKGRTRMAHIIPTSGKDRIMLSSASRDHASEQYIDAEWLRDEEVLNADTDILMLGGWLHAGGNLKPVMDVALERLPQLNDERAAKGKPKIKLMLTAAAQFVSANSEFKDMVEQAAATTDVIVCANTGELRRLVCEQGQMNAHGEDNYKGWRNVYHDRFTDINDGLLLSGDALETAKKQDYGYQLTKSLMNEETFDDLAVPMVTRAKEHGNSLMLVATNGAKSTYVIDQNGVKSHEVTGKVSKVVNTIGAGDNFAGGFMLGTALGLPVEQRVLLGNRFAGAVIQQEEPRLSSKTEARFRDANILGALATLNMKTTSPDAAILNELTAPALAVD